MTDANIQSPLVSYFRTYAPQRFQTADGKPLGRRALQKKINEFNLPIIVVGKGDPLIDPVRADDRLRQFAEEGRTPRRPGRPRKAAAQK